MTTDGSESLLQCSLDTEVSLLELVGGGVLLLELLERLGNLRLDVGTSSSLDLGGEFGGGDGLLAGVEVSLEVGLCLVSGREVLVGVLVLLGILDHGGDLLGRQTTDRVLDGDVGLSAGSAVLGGDLQQTVGVDLEGTDELGLSSGHGWDTGKLEFTEQSVVLALGSLTLVDWEHDGGLVVLDSGEHSGLVGGDGGVSGENDTEDVTLHGDTEGERGDIEEEEVGGLVRGLTGKDGGLDGGTVGNSLVRVDGLVQLTATEVLGNERLDLRDTGRTTDEDNVVDLAGRDLGVLEDLVDGVNGRLEGDGVDLLESGSGDVGGEVDTGVERVDLDGGLGDGRERSLGSLTGGPKTTERTRVVGDVVLGLALELGLEVLEQGVVEVLTTEMGVTSGGLDGEDLSLDGEQRDIERSSSEIEDEDVSLVLGLLVETVGNGGGGGLVDDSENLKTGNGSGVLGGETLGVVEVGGDAGISKGWGLMVVGNSRNDGLLDSLTELGLGNLLHLGEDHGGDLLGREGLSLVQVVDLDEWGSILVDDGERPVLHVLLDVLVIETTTDKSLGVEDSVSRVHGRLVLGG